MAGKFGKLPPDHTRPALKLSAILGATDGVPDSVDFISLVDEWPMYLNDQIGDCAVVAPAHAIEGDTQYAQGGATLLSEKGVLKAYKDISGYVEGDPSTDAGCVMQDVFDYWRKTGIDGNKILFFAKINPQDPTEVAKAIYYFGHVLYGIEVPGSAITQFDNGLPWSAVDSDGGIQGGHAVNVGQYERNAYKCVTWAKVQDVTAAFFHKYADEAWVVGTADWVSKTTQMTPTGLDLQGLGEEFAALTGEPNPFPDVPPPDPVPDPPPSPTPTPPPPSVDSADDALAPLVELLLTHHWTHITKKRARVLNDWLVAKGYK